MDSMLAELESLWMESKMAASSWLAEIWDWNSDISGDFSASGIVSSATTARIADRFSSSCFSNSCFTEFAFTCGDAGDAFTPPVESNQVLLLIYFTEVQFQICIYSTLFQFDDKYFWTVEKIDLKSNQYIMIYYWLNLVTIS